ncbi:MAG: hypothetical protein FWG41_04205, partial [Methanomassiliicoccaceae archaeon]|nr:hypothetical protein [Methanomassiliicoccaceae archaeon]
IVPLYHKIRLPFSEVWSTRNDVKKESNETAQVRFANSNHYKKELRLFDLDDPADLERPMPKYIWIYTFEMGKRYVDIIYDSTSANPQMLCAIYRKNRE